MTGNLTERELAVIREIVARDRFEKRVAELLHAKQRAFALSRAKRAAAQSGRRAGKSTGIAGKYLVTARNEPGGLSVFIAVSAARANEIISVGFNSICPRLEWAPKPTSRAGQLYWIFPNGHKLWVAGCKNRADADKFRGTPYSGAAVDECDSIRGHLQYLVEDCLDPSLMDRDGWLALTSTPGVTPTGYFWEATTGEGKLKKWETHHWTCLDNPYLRDPVGWLKRRREELGLDETSPTYLREWLGRWVRDLDALCYPYDPDKNRIDGELDLTLHGWRFVLGVDLGIVDSTAFVVLAYRDRDPQIHVLESVSYSGLVPSLAGLKVAEYRARYPGIKIVADTGGQGKAFVAEWAFRYGIHCEPAKKLNAQGQIALVGDLLRSSTIKVHTPGAASLAQQWSTVPWNEDRTGHDPAYDDHEADAARYGILSIRPLLTQQKPAEPPPGTLAYDAIEMAKLKKAALERAGKRR